MCSLLVALGASAAPVVRSLLDSPEPATRFYATLVASDLEVPSVVAALAARAFDEDADVREVALGGLAELARARERRPGPADAMARALDEAAARVRLRIGAPGCTPFERMHAVVAARALRDPRALPLLAPFAAWIERDLAAVAREALTLITAHDFGADAAAWQKWIRRHGEAPRVEWLVAALSGPKREMRAYAHVELVRVLGRDFGYSAEMGPIDRMVAQRRATKLARERGFVGGPR